MSEPILLPRILLTNDDGIDAPGIKVLAEIAQEFAKEVWIIAPEHDRSGASQGISLASPVRVWQRDERSFAVDGTPGDCVALAMSHFMAENPPSLILSGVNPGANLGDDVTTSGTIGAALIALILGIPAIAISQAQPARNKTPWDTTRAILPKVLKSLLAQGWRKETCLSVNIPDMNPEEITGFSWARQSQKSVESYAAKKRINPKHEEYYWIILDRKAPVTAPNSDSAIMRRGEVAVTPLTLDRSIDIAKPSVMFNVAENNETETAIAVNE